MSTAPSPAPSWPDELFGVLQDFDVRQLAYVPDSGHAQLIRRAHQDERMTAISLTTEEEGVALAAGAWLGGQRAALLMQSSGVGNCVNMFSLLRACKLPFLTLVTMRGEWGEFNPWQIPMASATEPVLRAMGIEVQRIEQPDEAADVLRHAASMAYDGGAAMAVLLSQRLIGAKIFKL
ncbi:MAG: thiamine pyrophosphate-binding protein [Burkholderiaceae bacterium]